MKKILLTSTGFSNKKFEKLFLDSVGKSPNKIKAIFVPTAAIDDEAKQMVPYCMKDLTDAGLLPSNILIYDLDNLIPYETAKNYDAIYFCGGDTKYLLNRINTIGFKPILDQLVEEGLFFIGVSAGSIIAANNLPDNLGYIDCCLGVHCENGSPCGALDGLENINLTNDQAIWINNSMAEIIK